MKAIKFGVLIFCFSLGLASAWFFDFKNNRQLKFDKIVFDPSTKSGKAEAAKRGLIFGVREAQNFIGRLNKKGFVSISEVEVTAFPFSSATDVFVIVRAGRLHYKSFATKTWQASFDLETNGTFSQEVDWLEIFGWNGMGLRSNFAYFDSDKIAFTLNTFNMNSEIISDEYKQFFVDVPSQRIYSSSLRFFIKDEKLKIINILNSQDLETKKSNQKILTLHS